MSAPTDTELLAGFSTFVDAARRLEVSYEALQERAAAVDLELARTNDSLSRTLAERETVFEALPVGVAAFAADGTPIWSNREADRLGAVLTEVGASVATTPAGERTVQGVTLRVDRADLPDGGTLVVLEERTRLVALEREVRRLDRLAGLSELALGVAHEIKNPLNGVLGYASLIERCDDLQELRRFAGRIREGIDKVDRIVKAMLAFARPVADSDRRADRPVREVVTEAALEAGVPERSVAFDGDGAARVDAPSLGRVLVNLFRNAVEAAGDRTPTIRIEATRDGDVLELVVADDGPGVPSELRDRLFDPFVSSKSDGHGLGLALAARVLSFLGGSIELKEAPPAQAPGGARFRVRLPSVESGREVLR